MVSYPTSSTSVSPALEPGEAVRISGEVLRQHLDGDITVELRIPRPVHLTHAALTERFKDFVMTEGFADQGG